MTENTMNRGKKESIENIRKKNKVILKAMLLNGPNLLHYLPFDVLFARLIRVTVETCIVEEERTRYLEHYKPFVLLNPPPKRIVRMWTPRPRLIRLLPAPEARIDPEW